MYVCIYVQCTMFYAKDCVLKRIFCELLFWPWLTVNDLEQTFMALFGISNKLTVVFHSICASLFLSILYRYRDINIFLWTGNLHDSLIQFENHDRNGTSRMSSGRCNYLRIPRDISSERFPVAEMTYKRP